MNGYAAELKKILAAHGWKFLRNGKGSHEIWSKPNCQPQTIPYACKSRPLANKILKMAGIDQRF